MSDARIERAEIAAGHDGQAELVVTVVFANGGRSELHLEAEQAFRVLEVCGASSLDDLAGRPWRALDASGAGHPNPRARRG